MVSKKILIPVIAVAVTGAVIFGINQVYAQSGSNPLTGLAQTIAQKFSLKQSDVQNVITSYRQQQKNTMQQNMQQRLKSRLDQEVKQGKINGSQEQAILDELTALKNKYNAGSLKTKTPAERQQAFKNMQSDLKTWAQSKDINISLIPGVGMGWHRGFRFGKIPTPTQ